MSTSQRKQVLKTCMPSIGHTIDEFIMRNHRTLCGQPAESKHCMEDVLAEIKLRSIRMFKKKVKGYFVNLEAILP